MPELLTQDEFPARSPLTRATDRLYGRNRKAAIGPKKTTGKDSTALHARNFLDCVRSRQPCACDIETGHRSTTATLIGNIAHKMKAYLEWDAKAEQFVGNDRANQFLSYAYRPPYELPGRSSKA